MYSNLYKILITLNLLLIQSVHFSEMVSEMMNIIWQCLNLRNDSYSLVKKYAMQSTVRRVMLKGMLFFTRLTLNQITLRDYLFEKI